MSTPIHRIEYFAKGEEVARAVWMGPVDGVVEIARASMKKKGADAARVVAEGTEAVIWSGAADV